MASGLFFSACDSSEPRAGEQEYTDAAAKEEDTKSQANQANKDDKDASTAKGTKVETNQAGAKGDGAKCGDDSCKEPATCKDDRCACPEGYEDVNGDGSECKDIDECKERKADCPRGAACKNEPGGYECMCNGPAYKQDGDECACADGYERNDDGFCAGDDGKKCSDGIDCKNGHCEGGICCAQSCGDPGECRVADGATCSDDGKSCNYPVAKDGATCDDSKACTKDGSCKEGKCQESKEATNCNDSNPCTDDSCEEPTGCRNLNNDTSTCDDGTGCTSEDKCVAGQCKGTDKDCSSASDACNLGACDSKSGECIKEARKTSATCDDSNSCTSGDSCKDGACVGSNACGSNSTSCEPGSDGESNMCSCKDGFETFEGRCVPTNDECQRDDNPCSENGVCTDPSNTDGDVTCACKPGFSGNGVECTETDPCATNPCGMGGTCTNGEAGRYTCQCGTGMREVGGKCGCDLSGTFAVRSTSTIRWSNVEYLEDGSVPATSWTLNRQSYDADGNLKIELTECGGTSFDYCSEPAPPFLGAEAYGQYIPLSIYGSPSMPRTTITVSLPASQPGAAFKTEMFALLNGIKLDDPMGEWPSDRGQIAGGPDSGGSPVNGASWVDSDNDGLAGLTNFAIGPEGEKIDGVFPDPPMDYGTRSVECPREGGDRFPYAYPPAVPSGSLSVQRVKRVYTSQRVTYAYDGKIDSCDAISGTPIGPDNGVPRVEARVAGCVRVNGSDETACAASIVDSLDQQPQTQNFSAGQFKMRRMSEGATCADARAANYD